MRKWKGLVPKPSKYLEAFLRRLKRTQIKELWILFKLHILLHSSKPLSLSLKRKKKKSREGMKDILFSLVDAGNSSLLHVWVVFILPITLLFVNVATWLTSSAVITHVNYSVCVLMFDKRKNFFFFDSGYKMREH